MADRPFFQDGVKPDFSAKELEKLQVALAAKGLERPDEAALLELAEAKKKPQRKLAYLALAELGSEAAVRRLLEELGFADEDAVCEAFRRFRPEQAGKPLVAFAEQKWKQYENLSLTIGLAFEGVLTACACIDPDTLEPQALKRLLDIVRQAAAVDPEPVDPNNPYARIEAKLELERVHALAAGILRESTERRTRP